MKRKFDPVLSAVNIYLTDEDIKTYNYTEDSWLVFYISNNTNVEIFKKIILGSIISYTNDLIFPSEKIYYYGKLNNEEKIVYKLKGKKEYHLMRIEFSSNNEDLQWTINRYNAYNNNYTRNDTNIGFITDKWINGRELLTIYIENGEDIYL